MTLALLFAVAVPAASTSAAPPAASASLEARAAARLCVSLEAPVEESLAGCRQAAELGLPAEWSASLRLYQARRLAALARWSEVIEIYRGLASERPREAEWPARLGAALLFGASRAEEAEATLREALSRDASRAETWALLGVALHALGRSAEAASSFERCRELAPDHLEARPALQEISEAAARGAAWP